MSAPGNNQKKEQKVDEPPIQHNKYLKEYVFQNKACWDCNELDWLTKEQVASFSVWQSSRGPVYFAYTKNQNAIHFRCVEGGVKVCKVALRFSDK